MGNCCGLLKPEADEVGGRGYTQQTDNVYDKVSVWIGDVEITKKSIQTFVEGVVEAIAGRGCREAS